MYLQKIVYINENIPSQFPTFMDQFPFSHLTTKKASPLLKLNPSSHLASTTTAVEVDFFESEPFTGTSMSGQVLTVI